VIRREDIDAAAERIGGLVRRTPVVDVEAGALADVPLVCKLELLQQTGSFKPRGAANRMLASTVPDAGVIAASGGNHGAAVAHVAARLGHRAEIFVPTSSAAVKVARIAATGATVHQVGETYQDAFDASRARAEVTAALVVHAFDDPEVVAGQGTVGRELAEQAGELGTALDTVLVAVGGGGLIAGITTWFSGTGTRVIGVEPYGCASLARALEAGERVDVPLSGIGVDSLGARRVGEIAFDVARRNRTRVLLVEDGDIVRAQRLLWDRLRVLAEPGGATALAALVSGAYRPESGERVAVVVCGGNTDPTALGWA
jgi:threonine dehydratase